MTYETIPAVGGFGMCSDQRRHDLWPAHIRSMLHGAGAAGIEQPEICDRLGLTKVNHEDMTVVTECLKDLKDMGVAERVGNRWYDWRRAPKGRTR